MSRHLLLLRATTALVLCLVLAIASHAASQSKQPRARRTAPGPLKAEELRTLSVQVALDRLGFSPGLIDARPGGNTQKALRAFQIARQLPPTGLADDSTLAALGEAMQQPLSAYVITAQDAEGPFADTVPDDLMAQSELPRLAYTSTGEMLGERFHTNQALLMRLNPHAKFEVGAELQVPNVDPLIVPTEEGKRKTSSPEARLLTVEVSDSDRTLTVTDANGQVRFHAPVTVGSERDPLPPGEFSITGVYLNPAFYYNPELFWDADPSHSKAKIAPGPNNPVGFAWLDLSREHLGFHGTPEPATVGKTQSHGCIRLTNWDVLRLASLVGEGTRVVLQ
jgi:lipoprotein-anchoring transpeptidase ErfK/SrfK